MTNQKKPYENQQVIDELLFLYKDYDNKIIRRFQIMDCVRDLYHLEHTGINYKDWVKEQSK